MSLFDRAPFRDPLAEDPGCAHVPAAPPPEPAPAGALAPVIAGGSEPRPEVSREEVTRALRTVFDPELGMSIIELGLVYGIAISDGTVKITMTLTTPGCPIQHVMPQWVREAVRPIPGVEQVEVAITFDPPWTPDRITLPSSR